MTETAARASRASNRIWSLALYAAMGLGFLTKGPIILMLVSVTIIPYLIVSRRLASGLRCLADRWGLLVFAALAASWPLAVMWQSPNAWRVWLVEISEKTGIWQTLPHHRHAPLASQWPVMMLPWSLIAMVAVILPFLPESPARTSDDAPSWDLPTRVLSSIWFPWFWAVGNLVIFSLWTVAKSNYYLPCLPGMALLIGAAWIRLTHRARGSGRGARRPERSCRHSGSCSSSPRSWRRSWIDRGFLRALALVGGDRRGPGDGGRLERLPLEARRAAVSLAPIAGACALGFLTIYGVIAPVENARRGHRELAQTLFGLVPPEVRSLRFFNEIDEGLWFYLQGMDLLPVPGSHPRYSTAFDLVEAYRSRSVPSVKLEDLDARHLAHDKQALFDWLDRGDPSTPYLLIRANLYDRLAGELPKHVTPLFRESGLHRNELILLHVAPLPVAAARDAIRY